HEFGFKTYQAADGKEALRLIYKLSPDLILLDMKMPVMDGYTTTKMIRQLELDQGEGKNTPVVALSANVAEDAAKVCYAAGMDDYLSKPIIFADLIRVLEKWLLTNSEKEEAYNNFSTVFKFEDAPEDPEVPAEAEFDDLEFMDVSVIRDLLGIENHDLEKSLIHTFLTDSKKRQLEMAEAYKTEDSKKINYLSHTIKGGAGNIGAKAIQINCRDIEDLSGEGNLQEVLPMIEKLGRDVQKLELYFERNYAD
ncbi:MAG: response regulator, partial [Lentisphaeraceae bacterium]|nr:response regulator [Lentisphaeraceae bacterium]